MRICIVWFRQDLRLGDNPALCGAIQDYDKILPVYIYDEESSEPWAMGAASRWWLHDSLESLQASLKVKGSYLAIREGDALKEINNLIQATKAEAVYWNRCYEPHAIARDKTIKVKLTEKNIAVKSFNASLLIEPWKIKNKQGTPYKVYTPFWNALTGGEHTIDSPLKEPNEIKTFSGKVQGLSLSDLGLKPSIQWDSQFKNNWKVGEEKALKQLKLFSQESVFDYQENRDRPDKKGTSRLAPHLHFGEISSRQVWHFFKQKSPVKPYLRQIVWREFAHHLLYHFPETTQKPLRAEFEAFPWKENGEALTAWQKGRTGFPIVDAGMRELWATGWMHNRVRMIVASFLVKDLRIHWLEGAKWFWDTLVDADLANNTMGWQWVSGCGADAAPYFRIFNPITQGEKFDPKGCYVRKWIPEIAALPDSVLHKPWEAEESILKEAGIELGRNYPKPIVNHKEERQSALMAYEKVKRK